MLLNDSEYQGIVVQFANSSGRNPGETFDVEKVRGELDKILNPLFWGVGEVWGKYVKLNHRYSIPLVFLLDKYIASRGLFTYPTNFHSDSFSHELRIYELEFFSRFSKKTQLFFS